MCAGSLDCLKGTEIHRCMCVYGLKVKEREKIAINFPSVQLKSNDFPMWKVYIWIWMVLNTHKI